MVVFYLWIVVFMFGHNYPGYFVDSIHEKEKSRDTETFLDEKGNEKENGFLETISYVWRGFQPNRFGYKWKQDFMGV